jgi:hypothetical protein
VFPAVQKQILLTLKFILSVFPAVQKLIFNVYLVKFRASVTSPDGSVKDLMLNGTVFFLENIEEQLR